jgi:FAD/FMN-containing dehydrogenase
MQRRSPGEKRTGTRPFSASGPTRRDRWIETARAYSRSLEPWKIGGGYLNYATEASGDDLETEFGAQRFERLRAVKRQYDPANVFRFNHNIAP